MKQESIEYFRCRERAERDAVRNASCEEARRAHEQMAQAYARLVELEELKAAGAVPPGKVVTVSEARRRRGDAVYARPGCARASARLSLNPSRDGPAGSAAAGRAPSPLRR